MWWTAFTILEWKIVQKGAERWLKAVFVVLLWNISDSQLLQNEEIFSAYLINWRVFIFLSESFEAMLPNEEIKKQTKKKQWNKLKKAKPICVQGLWKTQQLFLDQNTIIRLSKFSDDRIFSHRLISTCNCRRPRIALKFHIFKMISLPLSESVFQI